MIRLPYLDLGRPAAFPDVETAMHEPDGLLAAGGDLSSARLLAAYRRGIFPWYGEGQPILWWSPARRAVFHSGAMHVPRRLARWLRHCDWTIRADGAFAEVMRACAAPRGGEGGTWITPAMQVAYRRLHRLGYAHCVEVLREGELVGGIYGIAIGRMFFGESMFSRADNGSKVALLALARALHGWGFPLLDAQMPTPHLASLGARELARDVFCAEVQHLAALPGHVGSWNDRFPALTPTDLAS